MLTLRGVFVLLLLMDRPLEVEFVCVRACVLFLDVTVC